MRKPDRKDLSGLWYALVLIAVSMLMTWIIIVGHIQGEPGAGGG